MLVSLLLYSLVPVLVSILSSFLRTGVMICWCFLVLGEVPVLVSILLSSFFLRCIGVSSITGHLAMAWENTAEKTIHSVDAISQPRSFRALAEPDRTMLVLENDLSQTVLEEWVWHAAKAILIASTESRSPQRKKECDSRDCSALQSRSV